MALAFARAKKAAEEAAKGYYSQFVSYYGFEGEEPLLFDWDSAKAVAGESKHNSNEELLPKSVTIANYIYGSPNYLTGMVSNIAYKAGDDFKDLAFQLQRKHVKQIMLHFDDKNTTKKGECTWTCEVKDGVLHATMHWNFDQYMGRPNYEDVCTFLENYLDDKEALWFEIEKARMLADASSGSNYRYFNSDGSKFVTDTLGKELPFSFNWDQIKAEKGKSVLYSDKPPVFHNYLLVYALNDGRLMYHVRDILGRLLADDLGKEAFGEAFNAIHIEAKSAPKHELNVRKDGKTLVFEFKVKMDDHQNFGRAIDAAAVTKKVEALL